MRTKSKQSSRASGKTFEEDSNAPMMAIFGGVFGLLMVFLVIVNLHSDAAQRERLENGSEDGLYRIERLDGGSGFVVMTFPGELRIIETGTSIGPNQICDAASPFRSYARRVYESKNSQLVFFILEGGVRTMAIARECLRTMWEGRVLTIGWVIADNELLRSVQLDDIPGYIREYVEGNP